MRSLSFLPLATAVATFVYGQSPTITRLSPDGGLSWTNCADESGVRIESCSNLFCAADSKWRVLAVARDTATVNLSLPDPPPFYRIVQTDAASTIRYKALNRNVGWDGNWMYDLDMNGDGLFDLTFVLGCCVGCGTEFFTTCAVWQYDSERWHSGGSGYKSPSLFHKKPRGARDVLAEPLAQRREVIAEHDYYRPTDTIRNLSGPWVNVTNAYMPVSLVSTAGMHAGWIRMSVVHTNITVPENGLTNWPTLMWRLHDCAYETVPERGIVAGQTR